MSKPESTRQVIKNGYDFREYVYSKSLINQICGAILRRSHYKLFSDAVIDAKNLGVPKSKQVKGEDFFLDGVAKPSRIWYLIFTKGIRRIYFRHKDHQSKKTAKRAWLHEMELEKAI